MTLDLLLEHRGLFVLSLLATHENRDSRAALQAHGSAARRSLRRHQP